MTALTPIPRALKLKVRCGQGQFLRPQWHCPTPSLVVATILDVLGLWKCPVPAFIITCIVHVCVPVSLRRTQDPPGYASPHHSQVCPRAWPLPSHAAPLEPTHLLLLVIEAAPALRSPRFRE